MSLSFVDLKDVKYVYPDTQLRVNTEKYGQGKIVVHEVIDPQNNPYVRYGVKFDVDPPLIHLHNHGILFFDQKELTYLD